MGISKLRRNLRRQGGFGLIETTIAIAILAVGMLGAAALLAQLAGNSTTSRYMSTESVLASEKLDDLNRYPYNDPAIAVTTGNSAGSLTADVTDTVTANGLPPEVVNYFDQVRISAGDGNMVETVLGRDASGNPQYTTTAHSPDGSITVTQTASLPTGNSNMITFSRRWVIEQSPAGLPAGVRRFTVLVSLQNGTAPATFQASMVR
jgi:prepilin-type N-terminal cleavage/methylation domain-containing protein